MSLDRGSFGDATRENLAVAKNVTFEMSEDGLSLRVPSSGYRRSIDAVDAELFRALASTSDIEDAVTLVMRKLSGSAATSAQAAAEELRSAGVLVPAAGDDPLHGTYSTAALHYQLVRDYSRTLTYRSAIERAAPGQVMLEIGCGSGILSCFAAKAGAAKVYAIEEGNIIEVAKAVAEANAVSDRIEFIARNSMNVELSEPVDVIFSELISNKPFGQRIAPVLADAARRFLKPNGVMIPSHMEYFAIGVESGRFMRSAGRPPAPESDREAFARAYGLDLGPLIDAVNRSHEQSGNRHYEQFLGQDIPSNDQVLTAPVSIGAYDLSAHEEPPDDAVHFELLADSPGQLNAITTCFVARLDETTTLSSLPADPHLHPAWSQIAWEVEPQAVDPGLKTAFVANVSPRGAQPVTFSRA